MTGLWIVLGLAAVALGGWSRWRRQRPAARAAPVGGRVQSVVVERRAAGPWTVAVVARSIDGPEPDGPEPDGSEPDGPEPKWSGGYLQLEGPLRLQGAGQRSPDPAVSALLAHLETRLSRLTQPRLGLSGDPRAVVAEVEEGVQWLLAFALGASAAPGRLLEWLAGAPDPVDPTPPEPAALAWRGALLLTWCPQAPAAQRLARRWLESSRSEERTLAGLALDEPWTLAWSAASAETPEPLRLAAVRRALQLTEVDRSGGLGELRARLVDDLAAGAPGPVLAGLARYWLETPGAEPAEGRAVWARVFEALPGEVAAAVQAALDAPLDPEARPLAWQHALAVVEARASPDAFAPLAPLPEPLAGVGRLRALALVSAHEALAESAWDQLAAQAPAATVDAALSALVFARAGSPPCFRTWAGARPINVELGGGHADEARILARLGRLGGPRSLAALRALEPRAPRRIRGAVAQAIRALEVRAAPAGGLTLTAEADGPGGLAVSDG